jgi:hypothetical protein
MLRSAKTTEMSLFDFCARDNLDIENRKTAFMACLKAYFSCLHVYYNSSVDFEQRQKER